MPSRGSREASLCPSVSDRPVCAEASGPALSDMKARCPFACGSRSVTSVSLFGDIWTVASRSCSRGRRGQSAVAVCPEIPGTESPCNELPAREAAGVLLKWLVGFPRSGSLQLGHRPWPPWSWSGVLLCLSSRCPRATLGPPGACCCVFRMERSALRPALGPSDR